MRTLSLAKAPKRRNNKGTQSVAGSSVILPTVKLAGTAKAARPGSGLDKGAAITNGLNRYVAEAVNKVRTRTDINEIIRTLMREDGLVSSAANSMVALAAKSGYRIAGYNSEGVMSSQVIAAAYTILDKMDMLHDYSQGFNDKPSVQSILTTLQIDTIGSGGCGAELILDEAFGPERLVPVGYSTIQWEADGKGGRYPTQDGGEIDLNLPNVFIAEHNRNADEAYSVSLLRPGLSQVFQFSEFLEDTHRAVNRTGHSRLITTIDQEAVKQMAPPEVANNPEKMAQFYNSVKSGVEEALRALEPEDALVSYNTVAHKVEDIGGSKADYSTLMTTLGNLLGVSLKTPASVSGLRAAGGQGLSNAETLIYLKVVEATRPPVEEVMSRALTLAVRLLGIDGHIKFEFKPIDLRPETELEAYKGSRQKRILEQLSYGLITDAEACYELGVRPQGLAKEFSGTDFYNAKQEAREEGERESSTGRALNPDTPSSSGGDDQ